MTQARSTQISLQDTCYYHCISRCVRRAYLCGQDPLTGKTFNHRKQWLRERLHHLSQVFCIDICAYAIMSNHYHLVLYVNLEDAKHLSDIDVAKRWCSLQSMPKVIENWLFGEKMAAIELKIAAKIIATWRERLTSISWFMALLNQYISRKANLEDDCTGRFWEGRFKSQALLDKKALLQCMAYVDLNPIRAGITDKIEESEFTSIYERIHERNPQRAVIIPSITHLSNKRLMSLTEYQDETGIHFSLKDYLQLLKMMVILNTPSTKTENLNSSTSQFPQRSWMRLKMRFSMCTAVGDLKVLTKYAQHTGRRWVFGYKKRLSI